MDIEVLASGSKGNAYIVSDGVSRLLLECGIPFKQLQKKSGYTVTSLNGCLISHKHKDHCKAVADLIKNGVKCYCSKGTLDNLGLDTTRGLITASPSIPFHINTFKIVAFDTVHDCVEPLGFLIKSTVTGEALLFATDTAYIPCRPNGALDYIMVEANYAYDRMNIDMVALNKRIINTHMEFETLKQFFRANDLSKLKEVYLLHMSDDRGDEEKFLQMVREETGAIVYVV